MRDFSQRNRRVNVDHFSMVPRADIPRATFKTQHTHKTTFSGGWLIPIEVNEVLPGDSIHGQMTVFARMATLLFPLMDHITFETFFFFVPNRLLWDNWRKMMGERDNPDDSISFTTPQVVIEAASGDGNATTVYDYFGIPHDTDAVGNPRRERRFNALPFRAYNMIYNEWFRDQNLQDQLAVPKTDGPDDNLLYALVRRNKKHDYFTSALPWPLKNNTGVNIPLLGQAPISGIGIESGGNTPTNTPIATYDQTDGTSPQWPWVYQTSTANLAFIKATGDNPGAMPEIYADLSQATGATIAALRLAVQTQRLLERDARGGTRYVELLKAHFGVMPEDARLQRPEYIGGGRSSVQTSAIPQTSATTTTPLAALAGASTITGQHQFSYHATEHGFIIGLANVDAELTYQQGLHRLWTRQTRYDYYWPVFAHLSEQPIRNDEIYYQANAQDTETFGYQERWAEYRHRPSRISGLFRSDIGLGAGGSIDMWHAAQVFTAKPDLDTFFIEQNPPFARNLAAGDLADGQQFLCDMLFDITNTRAMPVYSVPGGLDRF